MKLQRRTLLGAATAISAIGVTSAFAQGYPNKAVRLVLPSPPGSLVDVMARLFGQGMKDVFDQPFIVDNKPGAGGALAAEVIAKSAPDGYNLLLATDSLLAINPFIYGKLPYDPVRDFKPVSLLAKTGVVMVASPQLGAKTLPEFIRLAKAKPGSINYGSGGNGHTTHLAMELFMKRANLKMVHVPYRGTTPAMQGLLGGEIGALIIGYAEALPHIKSGKVVALAATGPAAKTTFPDIPELKEIHPDLDFAFWFALLAPAGTPDATIAALNEAVIKASQRPLVKQKLSEFGVTALSSEPAAVASMIQSDLAKYGPIVKSLGIQIE